MQGVQFIQGFKIYASHFVNTIEELNTYTFEQDKEGNWLNKPIDANNHLLDALRYSLERFHLPHKQTKQMLGRILAQSNQWAYKEG